VQPLLQPLQPGITRSNQVLFTDLQTSCIETADDGTYTVTAFPKKTIHPNPIATKRRNNISHETDISELNQPNPSIFHLHIIQLFLTGTHFINLTFTYFYYSRRSQRESRTCLVYLSRPLDLTFNYSSTSATILIKNPRRINPRPFSSVSHYWFSLCKEHEFYLWHFDSLFSIPLISRLLL